MFSFLIHYNSWSYAPRQSLHRWSLLLLYRIGQTSPVSVNNYFIVQSGLQNARAVEIQTTMRVQPDVSSVGTINLVQSKGVENVFGCSTRRFDADNEYSSYGKIESFSPWFPETDPKNPQARTWIKKLSHRGTSLLIQILISITVLVFNIFMMIYAAVKYGISHDFGDLHQGDCKLVARYNIMIHLDINIVSTLLLGVSNYCAQLLMISIRSEVNRAHEKRD